VVRPAGIEPATLSLEDLSTEHVSDDDTV
jgi:hypothetical protein